MRRLALGLPTALQLDSTPPILFHERGVSQFTRNLDIYTVTKALKLSPPGQIWALVDSNQFAKEPAAVFRNTIFFVVEAVSFSYPRLERTPLHTSLFFMKTWSFSEALQAYVEPPPPPSVCITTFTSSAADHSSDPVPPHKERQLWYLYHEYGAHVVALANYAHIPSDYENWVFEHVEVLWRDLSQYPKSPISPDGTLPFLCNHDSCHLAVVMEPSPTSRSVPKYRIASPRIAEMLQERRSKSRAFP